MGEPVFGAVGMKKTENRGAVEIFVSPSNFHNFILKGILQFQAILSLKNRDLDNFGELESRHSGLPWFALKTVQQVIIAILEIPFTDKVTKYRGTLCHGISSDGTLSSGAFSISYLTNITVTSSVALMVTARSVSTLCRIPAGVTYCVVSVQPHVCGVSASLATRFYLCIYLFILYLFS